MKKVREGECGGDSRKLFGVSYNATGQSLLNRTDLELCSTAPKQERSTLMRSNTQQNKVGTLGYHPPPITV